MDVYAGAVALKSQDQSGFGLAREIRRGGVGRDYGVDGSVKERTRGVAVSGGGVCAEDQTEDGVSLSGEFAGRALQRCVDTDVKYAAVRPASRGPVGTGKARC